MLKVPVSVLLVSYGLKQYNTAILKTPVDLVLVIKNSFSNQMVTVDVHLVQFGKKTSRSVFLKNLLVLEDKLLMVKVNANVLMVKSGLVQCVQIHHQLALEDRQKVILDVNVQLVLRGLFQNVYQLNVQVLKSGMVPLVKMLNLLVLVT